VFHTLDHIVIAVRDLERATQAYSALLALGPSWRGLHPRFGTANTLYRLRNTYLELLAPEGEGVVGQRVRERLDQQGEGLLALALGTDDATTCATELRRRGLAPSDPVEGSGRDTSTGAERQWRNVHLPEDETRGVPLFAIEHLSPPESLPFASLLSDEASAVSGLDHVVVTTAAPDAACELYRDRLGIRLALDRTFDQRGLRLLFFRIGGITIEVAAGLGGSPETAPRDRLWGLAYGVPDIHAARERVAGAGFDISKVRAGQKEGTLVCTVRKETHGVATLLIAPAP
jgi:catechol 2,3-dioxygenase-like lactoylglutathione lyase family enzyme